MLAGNTVTKLTVAASAVIAASEQVHFRVRYAEHGGGVPLFFLSEFDVPFLRTAILKVLRTHTYSCHLPKRCC